MTLDIYWKTFVTHEKLEEFIDAKGRYMAEPLVTTLVHVKRDESLLLGLKKRGLGCGKWNGFGGKVEVGETVRRGARRELEEECGLSVNEKDLLFQGLLQYTFPNRRPLHVWVYLVPWHVVPGDTIKETDEMLPQWFRFEDLPWAQMWDDDLLWLPIWWERLPATCEFHLHCHFESIDGKIEGSWMGMVPLDPAVDDRTGELEHENRSP
ncbi:MAG: hypothetical protein KVP17_001275 [Porospora cf. gigantea B]|uniref:uncharacterized protein n=1 Tax=Porospora cf. gigantea B TaxID=2853592 RepID=UPI003571F0C0|nr:MAG: hypothetical protein KVP17_001275 [Porospora cf. gigantea B]